MFAIGTGETEMRFGMMLAVVMGTAVVSGSLGAQRGERDELLLRERAAAITVPAGTRLLRDVAYGSDPRQRFDVYVPVGASRAPVIFMVHGGGWRNGDKGMPSVVQNKVARWVSAGFVVVSTNYRMIPDANPVQQAQDIARAVAAAQRLASSWGADRAQFILMGHSAGAHLVALLEASPSLLPGLELTPWLGVVLLDSGALDVPRIMEARHFPLFDQAFGSDPRFWRSASPQHALTRSGPPILAVCSSPRRDSCTQARSFVARAGSLGTRASVLAEDLSHREINETLGQAGPYTAAVDGFLRTLSPRVREAVDAHPAPAAPAERAGRRGRWRARRG
jgi:arylformamidase